MDARLKLSEEYKAALADWVHGPHSHHTRVVRLRELDQALGWGLESLRVFTSETGMRGIGPGGTLR